MAGRRGRSSRGSDPTAERSAASSVSSTTLRSVKPPNLRSADHWSENDWQNRAVATRSALAALNIVVPQCLPGEADACGVPFWRHYGTNLAILKAITHVMLSVNLGVDPHEPVGARLDIHRTGWSPEDWAREATPVRDALVHLGASVPSCEIDGPSACGHPAWKHYLGFLIELWRFVVNAIENHFDHMGSRVVEEFGDSVYRSEVAYFMAGG